VNIDTLSASILDALIQSWADDPTHTIEESREQSLAVIKGVVEPALADLEQLVLFYSGEGEPEGPEILEWRKLATIDKAQRTPEQTARLR